MPGDREPSNQFKQHRQRPEIAFKPAAGASPCAQPSEFPGKKHRDVRLSDGRGTK